MLPYQLYIFDRDGTLNPEKPMPRTWMDYEFFPDVLSQLETLRQQGARLAVATNQGGVAFGYTNQEQVEHILNRLMGVLDLDIWAYCPCHPKGTVPAYAKDHPWRKPAPGMILFILQQLEVPASQAVYIGDRDSDAQAAKAAGVDFIWAKDFFNRPE